MVTGVYGWTIERIAYKPLRNSTRLAPLISAIGMSLILQNYAQLSGPRQQGVPTMLDGVIRLHLGEGFVQITYTKVFILVASFAGMLLLTDYQPYPAGTHVSCGTTGSKNGLHSGDKYRQDYFSGICHRRGNGRSGRVLITMNYGTFDFYVGFVIGIKAFTAAVLGGIGSLPGDARRADSGGGRSSVFRHGELGLQRCVLVWAAGHDPDFPPSGAARPPCRGQSVKEKTMRSHGFSLKRCLLDAMFSGLIALIIFGPIAGVVLDGYSFNFAGQRGPDGWHSDGWAFSAERFLSTAAGARFQARFEADIAGYMFARRNTKAVCAGLFLWRSPLRSASRLSPPNTC